MTNTKQSAELTIRKAAEEAYRAIYTGETLGAGFHNFLEGFRAHYLLSAQANDAKAQELLSALKSLVDCISETRGTDATEALAKAREVIQRMQTGRGTNEN